MTSTVFVDNATPIVAAWLNDVNNTTYVKTANLPTVSAFAGTMMDDVDATAVRTTIGAAKGDLGGTTLTNFTLDNTTAPGGGFSRQVFTNTVPNGWNTGAGRQTLTFDVLSTNFFSVNPAAHCAVVLRCDTSVVAANVRGQGMLFGNATGFASPSDLNPTPMTETWFNGLHGSGNYTWSNSDGARSKGGMVDGTPYRITVDAIKTNEGQRYIRYRMWSRPVADGPWIAEVDTGDVLDHNTWADLTNSGIAIGHVFGSGSAGWSLAFTNLTVTWGPAESSVPDQTIKLSRFGAELEGDLDFIGNGRRIKITSNGTITNWTTIQNKNTNQPTTLRIEPNGSSTTSNFLSINSSTPGTSYRAATYGMTGTEALLETFHSGQADPNLGINIGAGLRSATFKATGLNVLNATKDIGQLAGYSAGLTNWGGTNAASFSTTQTLDMEAFCTALGIRNYLVTYGGMPGAYADSIEVVLRPLYSLFSFLVKNLQDKKVI